MPARGCSIVAQRPWKDSTTRLANVRSWAPRCYFASLSVNSVRVSDLQVCIVVALTPAAWCVSDSLKPDGFA